MWRSFYSTGIAEFDEAHERIADIIFDFSDVETPADEQELMRKISSTIRDHIKSKHDVLSSDISDLDAEHDNNFLGFINMKIEERRQGKISKQGLASDLRHMLMVHVSHHQQWLKPLSA